MRKVAVLAARLVAAVLAMSDGSAPAARVAQAVQGAYGDNGTAAKACSPSGAYTWCAPQLPAAQFNPGWKTFESW